MNAELGWESIQKRGEILGLNIFHKIHLQETRPLIRKCMQKLDLDNKFNTRSNGGYIPYTNFGVDFNHSFFPYISSLWNSLPKIAKCKDLIEFKLFTNQEIKPPRFRHFATGNKLSN